MAIISTVPSQYPPPPSTPGLPVGGVVDGSSGNAQATVTDKTLQGQNEAIINLLGNVLVELQILNENLFRGVNLDNERSTRYAG